MFYQIIILFNIELNSINTIDIYSDQINETIMSYIYSTLNSVITAIKFDIFNIKCVMNFINIIITLYSDKKELFSKHLLKDIELFKKFSFIMNHLYYPQNNFIDIYKKQLNKNNQENNPLINSIDNNNNLFDIFILEKIIEKYDISKYLIKTNEDFSLNSEQLKNNMFYAGINPYIKDDPEMGIFMKRYIEENNIKKDFMIGNLIIYIKIFKEILKDIFK
jgi:hypothetical protein